MMRSFRHQASWLVAILAFLVAAPAWAQTAATDAPADAATAEAGASATEEGKEAATPAEPEPPPEASQLAQRLEETSTELRHLHAKISEQADLDQINKAFPPLKSRLDELYERQDELHKPHMGIRTLHDLENEWKSASTQLNTWSETLMLVASQSDEILSSLTTLSDEWELVRDRSKEDDLPEAVVQRIDTTLSDLAATEEEVRTRRAGVLELQNAVSEELVDTGTVLDLLEQARRDQQERLLSSDRPPLWSIIAHFDLGTPVWRQVADSYRADAEAIASYAADDWEPFAWQLVLFVALALLVASLDRQSRRTSFQDAGLAAAARVLRKPYSSAFLVAGLASPWIHPLAPGGLLQFMGIAIIPAVYRLLPAEFRERRDGSLACAFGLYLFGSLAGQVDRASDVHRVFMLIEGAGGVFLLLKFFKPDPESSSNSLWGFLARVGRQVLLLGLSLGILANIFGNVSLADLLTQGFLNTGFIAGILYAVSRVLDGVMIMLPRTGALGSVDLVKRNAQMFARRGIGVVRLGTVFVWFGFVLRFFQIRDQLASGLNEVMDASWKIGTFELSAGNLIVFAIAIAITITLARSLQFILRNDILPRLDLPRGVPGAISSATQYVVLSLGFLISLAAAGVDLGSIALVAGGLGVGIGFGLQNIVNNFVSGLILLFERPVRDGDFVEAATTFGEVKRIGFRSSTIRTFFGAEVIVPNADLISSTVINWTLSDNHRNQELPVRAAYGSDPEMIIELLKSVAAENENTLEDPPPGAFFMGFGENSLEFSLRFWTRFEVGFGTRSAVAIAVEKALREAGLAAPIPHRVVHLEAGS